MDDIVNKISKFYNLVGNIDELFDETNMFLKTRPSEEEQNIVNDINALLNKGPLRYSEDSETKLEDYKAEIERVNNKIKETDEKIAQAERELEKYKALEDSPEKDRLINDSTKLIDDYRVVRDGYVRERNSLESKLEQLNNIDKLLKAKLVGNKEYKISHEVSIVLTSCIGTEDADLYATIVSVEDKTIKANEFDELFNRFANALDKDMSFEKKAKLKSYLFPFVTNAMGNKNFSKEELERLQNEIMKYKATTVVEDLSSDEESREAVPETPMATSREEGHQAKPKEPIRNPAGEPEEEEVVEEENKDETKPEGTTDEMTEEMSEREIAADQSIAVFISAGTLPALELEELEKICKEVHIDISEKGFDTVLDKEQLRRLLFHKTIREKLLKKNVKDKTDNVLKEYDNLIEKYDKVIEEIKKNSASFSPEFLEQVVAIKERLITSKGRYIASSNKRVNNARIRGTRVNDVSAKLSRQYGRYEKFKERGKEKKMERVYQKIERLRGKEIRLMSKQVRITNRHCNLFLWISNLKHERFQSKQDYVLDTSDKILAFRDEINQRMERNADIRDDMLVGFDEGLSRGEVRRANREVRVNNLLSSVYRFKQGRVDRRFQVRQKIEKALGDVTGIHM